MIDKIFSRQNNFNLSKESLSNASVPVIPACRESFRKEGLRTSRNDKQCCFTNGLISEAAPAGCQKGFTLLEVLVSLALMGIVLVAIFQLFSAGLRGVAASDDYVNAVIRAEAKMREILDDQNLSEKSWKERTEDGYTIEATVNSTADDRTENLQVKLLEINLTVHWTNGIKKRSLTLKTMKVVDKQI